MPLLEKLYPLLAGQRYELGFAANADDITRAQALRYEVFNRELREGLSSSEEQELDIDAFDRVCKHLLIKDLHSNQVVGTYRMQTGQVAQDNLGYYCAQAFDLDVFEPYRSEIIELGRACIAKAHRNFQVLSMLWRGIAMYAQANNARYLIGSSSLTSQSPAEGLAAYRAMQSYLAPAAFQTHARTSHTCVADHDHVPPIKLPKLLSAYLSLGAWICGPPAIDREFKTIDFLTLMDLQSDSMKQRRQRFGITN
jgi:putative hemolysin